MLPSGRSLHSELERSTMLSLGKITQFRLGHGFKSKQQQITREDPPVIKRGDCKSTSRGRFNRKIIIHIYPPVIKHGWLENGPFISDFPGYNLHSVRGFSNQHQPAMFAESCGYFESSEMASVYLIQSCRRETYPFAKHAGIFTYMTG